jgi:outer membrane protein OmpA-like peptidoglycan-associated protein
MKYFYSLYLFLSGIFLLNPVLGQNQHSHLKREIRNLEKDADFLFVNNQFERALPLYLRLDTLNPDNPDIKIRIGKCYLEGDIGYKCLPFFEKARELKYDKEPLEYLIARAYHLNHRFDTAITLYETSLKGAVTKEEKDQIEHYIRNCRNGIELVKHPVKVKIENIGSGVNTKYGEYAPVISGDERTMILTSVRPDSYGGQQDEFGNYYEDIYISTYKDSSWTPPVNMGAPINSEYNDATISLSVDGQQLYIYQNDSVTGSGDIYVSNLKGGKWSKPEKMSRIINSKYWEPGASMIADENTFFFSSDKPGGLGGTDIYVCKRKPDGLWGEPKNLGPKINTRGDEDAPFIHPDSKTLYFSSTGHNSIGGFDIFTAQYNRKNDSVTTPENIGYPINTADDELFFVWSADGTRGYFSANREDSHGEKDIYVIHRPNIEMNLILFSGKINSHNQKRIPASIYVIDNSTNKVVAYYDSTKFTDNYTITLEPGKNYAISVESSRHLSHSENLYIPVNGFYELKKDVTLHPLEEGGLIVLNNIFFNQGSAELKKESFGELDRYFKVLKESPDLFVEIASHAFDYNDHSANLELSQKRAEAVVKYLLNKGIKPDMLRAVGYGDKFKILDDDSQEARKVNTRTELVILDKVKKNVPKKETAGFYNDRIKKGVMNVKDIRNAEYTPIEVVRDNQIRNSKPKESYLVEKEQNMYFSANAMEMKKVKEIKDRVATGQLQPVVVNGIVRDENGDPMSAKVQLVDSYGNLISEVTTQPDGKYELQAYNSADKKHSIVVHKEGYNFDSKDFTLPSNGTKKIQVHETLVMSKLKLGGIYILRNLYFDFNNSSLKKESFPELNKLVKLMKQNPDVKIEIAGHTDSRGPSWYNKKLSQSRCESVMNYLIKNGVDKERVKANGYGEEKPLASNDDEQDGRELNRRTEFVILEGKF